MDVLSSQANIAGYKAVMIAADNAYQRFFPMLMTAAGTIKAARVVILGVGVAGLQAIATAKRLGAVIEASDVRPAVKEQVESLGAKFIDVPYDTDEEKRDRAQGVGGYAKPMPPLAGQRQKVEVAKRVAQADMVITTALIPGRKGPGAGHRRHGQVHEARLGDRRPGRAPGRQLPADRSRPDRGEARCDAGGRDQPARHWWRPTRRRCTRAMCSTS
jgi:NAD/NADP transhydrogenase alpha subunit